MDTLVTAWAPSTSSKATGTVRLLSNHFHGDAWQDIADGINAAPMVYDATWDLRADDADLLMSFLRAHSGRSFYWTIPGETVARTWRAVSWNRSSPEWDQDQVRVTLKETFV